MKFPESWKTAEIYDGAGNVEKAPMTRIKSFEAEPVIAIEWNDPPENVYVDKHGRWW